MRESRYRSPRARPFRKTVAPLVREQHSRRCALSTGAGGRCCCHPAYVASVRRGTVALERSFGSLSEAVAWSETTYGALRRGELPAQPRERAPSLQDLAVSFLHRARAGEALTRSRQRYAASTIDGYEVALRLRVLPHREARTGTPLAALPADAIDGRAAQSLVDGVAVRQGAARARAASAALAAVLRDGYVRGYVDQLLPRVLQPPPTPPRKRVLAFDEADRLIEAARADDAARRRSLLVPLVVFLLGSGCRISEALGLAWGPKGLDLDAAQPYAQIARSSTKTDAGARMVPLDPATVAVLRRHCLASGRPDAGTPVFVDERGRPALRSGRVRFAFARAVDAADLDGVTIHTLRHTHATWLASAGVPVAVAAARLGHADGGALFLRTYAHPGAAEAATAIRELATYRATAQSAIDSSRPR